MRLGLKVQERLRATLRARGFDVVRYPLANDAWRICKFVTAEQISVVLDIGANDGGYAAGLRRHGYQGSILSVEPLRDPFSRLLEASLLDPRWDCLNVAAGAATKTITINVAGNAAASSSPLPMLERHLRTAPGSEYIGEERVPQVMLDQLVPPLLSAGDRALLKIDVQGYEGEVLAGSTALLEDPRLVGLQLELSLVDLYEGGLKWREGLDIALQHNFELALVVPGLFDPVDGRLLQFDAVFGRFPD